MADTKQKNVTIAEPAKGRGEVGGKLILSQDVIATIAAYAVNHVEGVVSVGRTGLNLALDGRSLLQTGPSKGISVEVGDTEAALDIEITVEFGVDIIALAAELRTRVAEAVSTMAGRAVVVVDISVIGIQMPDETPRLNRVQ